MSYYFKFHKECPICSSSVIENDEPVQIDCFYCHDSFISNYHCKEKHFICDQCSNRDGWEIIKVYCETTMETNPLEMAENILTHVTIEEGSPEHSIIVPAVLIASFFNTLHKAERKNEKLAELFKSANCNTIKSCKETGVCGAAASSGRIIELISDEVNVSVDKWKFGNYMAANAVYAIANYMTTQCCKRDVLLSIKESVEYIAEHLQVFFMLDAHYQCDFPVPAGVECDDACPFKKKNPIA
jgi:Family of unknown function (DUF5714)